MPAAKALEALEQMGGNLFGGDNGHIPPSPSFSSANSAFLKHFSSREKPAVGGAVAVVA